MRRSCHDLTVARGPVSSYGSSERAICDIRDRRPLDLNAELWRQEHPGGSFRQWQQQARACLAEGLHYDGGPADLKPEVLERQKRDGFVLERVAFNTTPWFRLNGFFLLPEPATYPVPGLVVFHAWGGPMLFGKERVVNTGRTHPALEQHRNAGRSGRYLGEVFARRGYAVIVIDAYHFGQRAPRGLGGIPAEYDPFDLTAGDYAALDELVRQQLYLGVRQLNWAGTTWMGVNYWDDLRCVDYLVQRPEVDSHRIGCTGVSGGGWRTNILAALDDRIKACVSVGWMTTGDYQQKYDVANVVGTFCLLPGVWDRLDVPDLTVMAAPAAAMVVNCGEDPLFPPEGQAEAARQIQLGYEWAGCPDKFRHHNPPKPHCYDADIQAQALAWFEKIL